MRTRRGAVGPSQGNGGPRPAPGLPSRAAVVIIGGGVVGCSIAYQLAARGAREVVLVERRELTDGSTWHAAGLVGQLRTSANLTRLMAQSVAIYQHLEEATGYPTGWRGVGSLRIASSSDRWYEVRRLATAGKSFGFEVHLLSAREAKELFPLLDLGGIHGATFVESDGYVDPSQLTQSFAAGARAAGVQIVQNCRVERMERRSRRVTTVVTEHGPIECETVVNATGMWGAETAALAGARIAVSAVEHQYIVTERTGELPDGLPTLRDPDARFYVKPDAGALAIGGWEDGTRVPWHRIPRDLGPELFAPDYERFAPIHDGASRRIPAVADLGIRTFVNGPIPFSPDAEPLLGLTEDLDNVFHCCGFPAGVAAAGGAGWAIANWVIDGDPGMDLWDFDVRRFGRGHDVRAYLERRAVDAYAHYYALSYPDGEVTGPRGQRRSPLYEPLAARGAVFGAKFGWERPNWFAPDGAEPAEHPSFGRSNAFEHVGAEHRAVRSALGIIDQSSFAKFEISGPGALPLLQSVAGNQIDVPVGSIVYTQLLNEQGGIEADVTVTRIGPDRFYLVTGSAFGRHDASVLSKHAPVDSSVTISEVTSSWSVINVCGPRSRELLARLTSDDLSNAAFGYMTARALDVGHAPVRALRATYVGELGFELHVPTEYAGGLYEQLRDAGEDLSVRDVGYRALDSLRLEKHYVAWAVDVTAYMNPYEAGLGFAVRPDKPDLLAGPALRKVREDGPARRLCWFTCDGAVVMHGGECLVHVESGQVSPVRSAGYGHSVERTIFSAVLPRALAFAGDQRFVVEVAGALHEAVRDDAPPYDPRGERIRA